MSGLERSMDSPAADHLGGSVCFHDNGIDININFAAGLLR
jgi:hypothetical protein